MRLATKIWVSAALMAATTAMHLTIEQDLLGRYYAKTENIKLLEATQSTTPFVGTEKDMVQVVSGEEHVSSGENKEIEVVSAEQSLPPNSIQQTVGSSKSTEKVSRSNEADDVIIPAPNPDNKANGGIDGGSNGGGNGVDNSEADGGGNSDTEGEANVEPEDGANGEPDGGPSGEDNDNNDDAETGDTMTIIQTTTGPVRGNVWRDNTNIISYIDIKYGIFKSNFEAPESPEPWQNVHEAKDHSKRCPQLEGDLYVGDTDCLTLNIFKPSNAANASVLFYIHEGHFTRGSGNPALYGPEYLVSKGIILVLPNYRLGPLGFLCLQNETAEGNAALKDLTLALSWIKANIAEFGGNPANIAVSGDGTSGALAGYLALSSMSKSYISKVITESGSVLSSWALDRNPIVSAAGLAYNINDFQSWQNVETSILVTAAKDVVLRPCLERNTSNGENFMVETPWAMIEDKNIKITFMIGSAMYAGIHDFLQHAVGSIQQLNDDVGLLLPNDLSFENNAEKKSIGEKVKNQYFGESDITASNVEQLTLYFTDAAYLGPGIRTARSLVELGATVYLYEFSFVGDLNRELEAINRPVEGAVRGDIVGYLFTQDGIVPDDNTKERRMVDQLIQLWSSFLKTGTPAAEDIEWNKLEKANEIEEQWLSIATETTMKKGLHVDRLRLWTDIYNQHFIERNLAFGTSASVNTMLILQLLFWLGFFRNTSHVF